MTPIPKRLQDQLFHRPTIKDEPLKDISFLHKDPIEEVSLLLEDIRYVSKERMVTAVEGSPDRRRDSFTVKRS